MLAPHQIHLHATTPNLASQFRRTEFRCPIRAIPYPTRPRPINEKSSGEPLKAVLAGLPRPEKGKAAIFKLLSDIERPLLRTRRFRLSMQMRSKRWQPLIPPSLHGDFERAAAGSSSQPLELMINNLSTDQYHDWLDTADVGLFLYDPRRYLARCSGVLLEMLVRGVPVIVPDRCWLADQVRLAGGDGSIGFIYKDRSDIAGLMSQFARGHDQIRKRSIEYAATIARRHAGKNTLLEMGLPKMGDYDRKVA
jgi:glycosyltransferase involved in cell wall biosynthesis